MERTDEDRERLITTLQGCRRDDAELIARMRGALEETADERDRLLVALEEIADKHDGGEFPDSYQLGLREAAYIARTALSGPSPERDARVDTIAPHRFIPPAPSPEAGE